MFQFPVGTTGTGTSGYCTHLSDFYRPRAFHLKLSTPGQHSCPALLDHNSLLLRANSALGVLRSNGDGACPVRQLRSEELESTVAAYHGDLLAVDHDPRSGLGSTFHLDHVSVLDER